MTHDVLLVLLLFASFLAVLFTGYPVAMALGGVGILFAVLGEVLNQMGVEIDANLRFTSFVTNRIFDTLSNYSLIPMSMFVFMGFMLDRSGIADRLLSALRSAFGRVPGGLGLAVVAIGVVLAASTGIIGASVVLLATIAIPAMNQAGYDKRFSLGTVGATGCLGILIPPSIMLVVMGDQLRLPVGDLFLAAVIPGFLLAGLYAAYIVVYALINPAGAPSIPASERAAVGTLAWEMVRSLVAPLALIFAVLGSIFLGIASPTEASGVGAAGASALAYAAGRLDWKTMKEVCWATAKTTAFLYALIFGASCFSVVLRGYGGDTVIAEALHALPLPPQGVLFVVVFVVFLLGFVLDWMEIVLIVAPLVMPIVVDLGFDPVWVAILLAVCLQTSFLTPPVGAALFYLKSVAVGSTVRDIYAGVVPFVLLQLLGLALVWIFPDLALWLPHGSR